MLFQDFFLDDASWIWRSWEHAQELSQAVHLYWLGGGAWSGSRAGPTRSTCTGSRPQSQSAWRRTSDTGSYWSCKCCQIRHDWHLGFSYSFRHLYPLLSWVTTAYRKSFFDGKFTLYSACPGSIFCFYLLSIERVRFFCQSYLIVSLKSFC